MDIFLEVFQEDYHPEEGSQLEAENDPQWSLKSPSPDKDWVGVGDVEVSTRVPSDSSDVVVSGDVWVDLSSISDLESESCGKVLLCVSVCLGLWSARLTTIAWEGNYICTFTPTQHQRSCCSVIPEKSGYPQLLHLTYIHFYFYLTYIHFHFNTNTHSHKQSLFNFTQTHLAHKFF